MTLRPPFKYVGGKSWLAPRLADLIGERLRGRSDALYIEPFLGAGAVALAVDAAIPKRLGDFNAPVMGLWRWIKRNPKLLHSCVSSNWANTVEGFNTVRDYFNRCQVSDRDPAPAARLLWLLAADFNGLFRVNRSGLFNVPWGKREKLSIASEEHLIAIAAHLQNATLNHGDFATTIGEVGPGTVLFMDPPYDVPEPDERSSSGEAKAFVDYVGGGFGPEEQSRLADVAERARAAGAFVMISNADTRHVRMLFSEARWLIEPIAEKRSVAAAGDKRAPAACLLITSR